jgi:hypothetical protein
MRSMTIDKSAVADLRRDEGDFNGSPHPVRFANHPLPRAGEGGALLYRPPKLILDMRANNVVERRLRDKSERLRALRRSALRPARHDA